MLLKIYQAGQPVLRNSARPVALRELASKSVQDLIDAMIATLRDAPGVGLSAPQLGQPLRICIIEDKVVYHKPLHPPLVAEQHRRPVALKVIVNPQIELIGDKQAAYFEGCLSIEGYTAVVPRHGKVKVTGLDRNGVPINFTANGWLARIVQHEIDHLNGRLYIDKMRPASFMTLKNHAAVWKTTLQAGIDQAFPSC